MNISSLSNNTQILDQSAKHVSEKSYKNMQRLESVAKDFESVFAKMLVQSMYKSVDKSNALFSRDSPGQKMFNDMLHEEYAHSMARTKSIGIADMIISYYKDSV